MTRRRSWWQACRTSIFFGLFFGMLGIVVFNILLYFLINASSSSCRHPLTITIAANDPPERVTVLGEDHQWRRFYRHGEMSGPTGGFVYTGCLDHGKSLYTKESPGWTS